MNWIIFKTAIKKIHWFVVSNFNISQKTEKQKFFFGQSKSRQNFSTNRTGGEPHLVRARFARRTAKTLAIFANRRRKILRKIGKFEIGALGGNRTSI